MAQDSLFTADEFKKMKGIGKKKKHEEKVQLQVCEYIKKAYPDVIFTCDLASGMKLPIWVAAANKKMRSSRGFPDLYIACPKEVESAWTSRDSNGNFNKGTIKIMKHGLFIEIKKEGIRLKNGTIPKTEHHTEQAEILARLNQLNYKAVFGCGFEECKNIIDEYLK